MIDVQTLIVVALVAVLAAMLGAVAGFGGAALMLPVLTWAFGVRDAIPILTVAQLIGNASRAWFNRRELAWPVVGWFALGAIPMALLGGIVFASAPAPVLRRLLGGFLLATVLFRHTAAGREARPSLREFALIGAVFSFLSALLGSVGPIMAPFFLAYGLVKGAYIGTEALSTVMMRVPTLVAYGGASILRLETVAGGAAIGLVMILGSYLGKQALDRVPERVFPLLVEAVLVVAGVQFLVFS